MGAFNALKASNPTLAAQHLQRYVALKDSIYQHDMEQAVSQSNAKYKNGELTLQAQHEQKEKRIVAIAAIVVVTLLLLVVVALIYVGKIRQRNHALLKQVSQLREKLLHQHHPRIANAFNPNTGSKPRVEPRRKPYRRGQT